MNALARLRDLLGFSVEEVAVMMRRSREDVRRLEENPDELEDEDAEQLSRLYGVDVLDALAAGNPEELATPLASLLKAKADVLDASSRFAMTEAMAVARLVRELQGLLEMPAAWDGIAVFADNPNYGHPREGVPSRMAEVVRQRLSLGIEPLSSVQHDVLEPLGVLVLVADVWRALDAFSFATPAVGGVIVLNQRSGASATAFGRRVALAHELCHVLFDRGQMRAIADFCVLAMQSRTGRHGELHEGVERRARAFAAYLLAPLDAFEAAWRRYGGRDVAQRVRLMMEEFGLGYEATRAHLDNAGLLKLQERISNVPTAAPPAWEERDRLPIQTDPQLLCISPLRRGALLAHLRRAWSAGLVSEGFVRESLELSLAEWQLARDLVLPNAPTTWSTSSALAGGVEDDGSR